MNMNPTKAEVIEARRLLSLNTNPSAATPEDENLSSGVEATLFCINLTRAVHYHYAILNANGEISMHVMAPFKTVNTNERNPQYRSKIVWASFNKNVNANPNNANEVQNSNYGNFLLVLAEKLPRVSGDGEMSNFLNSLNLYDARLKTALVPNDYEHLSEEALQRLTMPIRQLIAEIKMTESQDIEKSERAKLNRAAYEIYAQEVLQLVEEGLLTLSTIYINPIQNKVAAAYNLEESLNFLSHPAMNYNHLMNNCSLPISMIPTLNTFRGVVELTGAGIDALLSDNAEMLGLREMSKNRENVEVGKEQWSMSKVGIIKDYSNDVRVLVTINDTYNSNNRSRVRALEAQLEKGNNLLRIESGYLVPIARRLQTNDARSGIAFMELRIERYSIHNSNSLKKSALQDDFAGLDFKIAEADVTTDLQFLDQVQESQTEEKAKNNQVHSNTDLL